MRWELTAAAPVQEVEAASCRYAIGMSGVVKARTGWGGSNSRCSCRHCWLAIGQTTSPHRAAQELNDTREKFEMGLGESRFYHALAKQAQDLTPAGAVGTAQICSGPAQGVGGVGALSCKSTVFA